MADPVFARASSGTGRRDESEARRGPALGDVIDGRYELRRQLGSNEGSTLFEAVHRFTGRAVAVKFVADSVDFFDWGEQRERLAREARALAAIRHPGVVDVLDGGMTPRGGAFIVLEMLTGRTLEGLFAARGKLSLQDSLGVTLQLCDAMAAAHEAGVVHRDLSPANIFVVRDFGSERLKVTNFGFAAIQGSQAPRSAEEQADVDAVGVTLYQCLTGVRPNADALRLASSSTTKVAAAMREHNAGITPALADVIARAVFRERGARYRSMSEFRAALLAAAPGALARTWLLAPSVLREPVDSERPADATAALQRRRKVRAPYTTPVRIVLPSGEGLDGRNEDISEGGLLVISPGACEPGQRVTVRFALPIDGRVTECAARVRWVRAARPDDVNGPCAIGLEFLPLPSTIVEAIAQYVALMADPSQSPAPAT